MLKPGPVLYVWVFIAWEIHRQPRCYVPRLTYELGILQRVSERFEVAQWQDAVVVLVAMIAVISLILLLVLTMAPYRCRRLQDFPAGADDSGSTDDSAAFLTPATFLRRAPADRLRCRCRRCFLLLAAVVAPDDDALNEHDGDRHRQADRRKLPQNYVRPAAAPAAFPDEALALHRRSRQPGVPPSQQHRPSAAAASVLRPSTEILLG